MSSAFLAWIIPVNTGARWLDLGLGAGKTDAAASRAVQGQEKVANREPHCENSEAFPNHFVYICFNSRIRRAPRPKGGYRLRTATRPFLPFVSSDQPTLQRVLANAAHPDVKLLLDGRTVSIPALIALRLARSGRYDWSGTPHRVRKMRPVHSHPWQACYRTTRAATLQPSVEWLDAILRRR